MRIICLVVVALMLVGLAPLSAADNAFVISVPRVVPANGGQSAGALATAVTVGLTDPNFTGFGGPGVPCFNCVPTSGVTNIGLSLPLTWLSQGTAVTYILIVDVATYSGVGDFIYSLHVGTRSMMGKEIAHGSVTASVYPSTWAAEFPSTVPMMPGRYTLDGIFDAGGATSAVTVPIIIQ